MEIIKNAEDVLPGDLVVARRVIATVVVVRDASPGGGHVTLTTTDDHTETFHLDTGIPVQVADLTATGS
jgi:hypothetical protein